MKPKSGLYNWGEPHTGRNGVFVEVDQITEITACQYTQTTHVHCKISSKIDQSMCSKWLKTVLLQLNLSVQIIAHSLQQKVLLNTYSSYTL